MLLPSLAKCGRCKELFPRDGVAVCQRCWPQEQAEYSRIRDTLAFRQGLTVLELATAAQVSLDVVTRMLDAGRLQSTDNQDEPYCGRCGAPAISHGKRLCQACLIRMDQKCAEAMRELHARMGGFATARVHRVHASLAAKRTSRSALWTDIASTGGKSTRSRQRFDDRRMVAPQNREARSAREGRTKG